MWGSPNNHTPHSDFFSDDLNINANLSSQQDATHILLHANDYSMFQKTDRITWHLSHSNSVIFTQQVST